MVFSIKIDKITGVNIAKWENFTSLNANIAKVFYPLNNIYPIIIVSGYITFGSTKEV